MPNSYSLILAFIDPSDNNRALRALYHAKANGATILYGRGTVRNPILNLLGLDNPRKEILITLTEEANRKNILEQLHKELHMERHGHGICVALPITRVYGLRGQVAEGYTLPTTYPEGDDSVNYELIVSIANHGKGEDVVEAAQKAGATGATLLHGRGSGVHKVEKFFNLEIEPEKEVIFIVSECSKSDAIIENIRTAIDFNTPNSGIIFTLSITDAIGLVR